MGFDDLFPNGLSVADAVDLLEPLALYVAGMAIYAVFVFNFYRFVAQRDMFMIDFSRYEESRFRAMRVFLGFVMYILKYLIVFPLFAFFWFGVLTAMLVFLSLGREIAEVLLISLATVSAIRFSAYYSEDLSRDIAKMLPFALLGIFIIDGSFVDIGASLDVLSDLNDHREPIVYYLAFLIGLEFVLRLGFGFSYTLFRQRPSKPAQKVAPDDPSPPETSETLENPEGESGSEENSDQMTETPERRD